MGKTEQFVGEAIQPDPATFDVSRMAAGEPGMPWEFRWRRQTLRVAAVLRTWRETGPCRHGSGEAYVRKHWYEVQTDDGQTLTLYCDRSGRRGDIKRRWWLFSSGTDSLAEEPSCRSHPTGKIDTAAP